MRQAACAQIVAPTANPLLIKSCARLKGAVPMRSGTLTSNHRPCAVGRANAVRCWRVGV